MRKWDASFGADNMHMDSEHQRMVEMIDILYQSMKKGQNKNILTPLIDELHHYAENHFTREENFLGETKNPEINSQQQQYMQFLNKVTEFKLNFESGNTTIAIQMLPFLKDWFLNHIMKVDMKYKA